MNKTISISKTTSDSSPQASPHPPLCSPPLLLPSFILENKKIYNTRLHNREKVWHFHNFHKVDLNSGLWSVRHWTLDWCPWLHPDLSFIVGINFWSLVTVTSTSSGPTWALEGGHPLRPSLLSHLLLQPHRHLHPPGCLPRCRGDQAHPGQDAHCLCSHCTR